MNDYSKPKKFILFTIFGQVYGLKNWWDNYLTFEERLSILYHTTEELDE